MSVVHVHVVMGWSWVSLTLNPPVSPLRTPSTGGCATTKEATRQLAFWVPTVCAYAGYGVWVGVAAAACAAAAGCACAAICAPQRETYCVDLLSLSGCGLLLIVKCHKCGW